MNPSTRASLWMAFFLAGIAAGSHRSLPVWPAAWCFVSICLLAGARIRRRTVACLLLCASGCLAGYAYCAGWRYAHRTSYPFGEKMTFSAVVAAPPDRRQNKTLLTVRPVEKLGLGADGTPRDSLILVSAGRNPLYHYGDLLSLQGELEEPAPFNGFDYPLYLERFGISAQMGRPRYVRRIGSGRGNAFLAALYGIRQNTESIVQDVIPEPEASFLNGIMLGSKRAIPSDIQADLKQTGTSHIIAISGANITILLGIILQALPLYRRRQQFWATGGIALFVSLLTGASASVLRGALVAGLSSHIRACSRRAWPTPLILLSMVLLLLANPLLLVADPGFQLSYAAFAGLAYFGAPVRDRLDAWPPTRRLPEAILAPMAETTAATLGTALLSFKLFGQLSLLGLVVNPLVLWLLPPITLLGLALCVLGRITPVAALLKVPLWLLLHSALGIIGSFGQVQVGVIHWQSGWEATGLLLAAASGLAVAIRKLRTYENA